MSVRNCPIGSTNHSGDEEPPLMEVSLYSIHFWNRSIT
jgi:hypothetical protein